MVPRAGVEPATISLGRIYSIQLSYRGVTCIIQDLLTGELLVERFVGVELIIREPVSDLFFGLSWVT